MTLAFTAQRLNATPPTRTALRSWPADRALALLWSAPGDRSRTPGWSRWTVLAEPAATLRSHHTHDGRVRTDWRWADSPLGHAAAQLFNPDTGALPDDPLAAAAWFWSRTSHRADPPADDAPPFIGGWIGSIAYEMGRFIEPAARAQAPNVLRITDETPWPLMLWHWCPVAYVHDNTMRTWWRVGPSELLRALPPLVRPDAARAGRCRLAHPTPTQPREQYEHTVQRILEYIRAGDVFQVNAAHVLRAGFAGSARALASRLLRSASPWYGAYLEDDPPDSPRQRSAALSLSPELFLAFDPDSRDIVTRPIKGTRRGDADPRALLEAEKDKAELHMIVDLMRNDLGRVAEFGSVRVEAARTIERHARSRRTHPGVLHAVATVRATMRAQHTLDDLLRAAFPPGSITGAPKIRAMQIIEELEPCHRGPYCGAIGFVSASGHARFNVAIRTALLNGVPDAAPGTLRDGTLSYPVGAGIVADSDPRAEWLETLDKAGVFRGLRQAQSERAAI